MKSFLLHGLPNEYKGVPLRTEWRVGVSLTLLFQSHNIDEPGVLEYAYRLLYPDITGVNDTSVLMKGLNWFLSLGESDILYLDKPYKTAKEQQLDFIEDQLDIIVWFRKGYSIDILDPKYASLHWFLFMTMLYSATDCPLADKFKTRAIDLSKIKDSQMKKGYAENKQMLKVHEIVDKDELTPEIEEAYRKALNGDYIARSQLQAMGIDIPSED